jgi:hypothetical protein
MLLSAFLYSFQSSEIRDDLNDIQGVDNYNVGSC